MFLDDEVAPCQVARRDSHQFPGKSLAMHTDGAQHVNGQVNALNSSEKPPLSRRQEKQGAEDAAKGGKGNTVGKVYGQPARSGRSADESNPEIDDANPAISERRAVFADADDNDGPAQVADDTTHFRGRRSTAENSDKSDPPPPKFGAPSKDTDGQPADYGKSSGSQAATSPPPDSQPATPNPALKTLLDQANDHRSWFQKAQDIGSALWKTFKQEAVAAFKHPGDFVLGFIKGVGNVPTDAVNFLAWIGHLSPPVQFFENTLKARAIDLWQAGRISEANLAADLYQKVSTFGQVEDLFKLNGDAQKAGSFVSNFALLLMPGVGEEKIAAAIEQATTKAAEIAGKVGPSKLVYANGKWGILAGPKEAPKLPPVSSEVAAASAHEPVISNANAENAAEVEPATGTSGQTPESDSPGKGGRSKAGKNGATILAQQREEKKLKKLAQKEKSQKGMQKATSGTSVAPLQPLSIDVSVTPDDLARLEAMGSPHTPTDVIFVNQNSDGNVFFLEQGHSGAGYQHILRHSADFLKIGVTEDQIIPLLRKALVENKIVGHQGSGPLRRPIFETMVGDEPVRVAISVSDNGYIVGANPVGRGK